MQENKKAPSTEKISTVVTNVSRKRKGKGEKGTSTKKRARESYEQIHKKTRWWVEEAHAFADLRERKRDDEVEHLDVPVRLQARIQAGSVDANAGAVWQSIQTNPTTVLEGGAGVVILLSFSLSLALSLFLFFSLSRLLSLSLPLSLAMGVCAMCVSVCFSMCLSVCVGLCFYSARARNVLLAPLGF